MWYLKTISTVFTCQSKMAADNTHFRQAGEDVVIG
jgi:hypothetical protein